jgi:membrane protease YdiL (CAAX protease family)
MRQTIRSIVRPIALTIAAPAAGLVVLLALRVLLKIKTPRLLGSVVNLILVAGIALVAFPRWLGIPFGRIGTREFLRKTGFYLPGEAWRHVLLGLILAGCTLSGMLAAAVLSGKYVFDPGRATLPHLVFCLNPALWEELFYRGVLMLLLLKMTRSLRRAFLLQVILFGLAHIKGLAVESLVDAFSVMLMAVGLTCVAVETRALVAGVVFHYFHNALLFLVQVPSGTKSTVTDTVVFYGCLWLMIGVACAVARMAAERLGVRAPANPYSEAGLGSAAAD